MWNTQINQRLVVVKILLFLPQSRWAELVWIRIWRLRPGLGVRGTSGYFWKNNLFWHIWLDCQDYFDLAAKVCGVNNCLTEFSSNFPGVPGLWDEEDDCCTRWSLSFEKKKKKGDLAKKKKGRKKVTQLKKKKKGHSAQKKKKKVHLAQKRRGKVHSASPTTVAHTTFCHTIFSITFTWPEILSIVKRSI